MGRALREICDARLYRATHGTFEDYCEQRGEIARRHAYRLIDGAAAVVNVSDRTQGITLEAVRPLAGLPPEQQREVWAAAEARDAQGQPKITGRLVAEAAGKVVPLRRSARGEREPVYHRDMTPTEKQIEEACDRYGAKVVSDAAYGWMEGNRAPAQRLGLNISNLPHARLIADVAYQLMSPEDQAMDYAAATIDLARIATRLRR